MVNPPSPSRYARIMQVMRASLSAVILGLMLPLVLLAAAAATAPDHAARVDYLRSGLEKTLTSMETKANKPAVSITTRDLTNGALAEVILHGDGQRAANLLRLAFDTQDMDPKSAHYGML